MEKQVIVISYVGEEPTPEQAKQAIVSMLKSGVYMDTTVEPTLCCLSEKEQAQAMMMFTSKKASKGAGITVTVKNPEPIISATKAEKLARVLRELINNE